MTREVTSEGARGRGRACHDDSPHGIQNVQRQPSVRTEYPMKVKLARAVLTHDCGVVCPGSGVHAAVSGAHRGSAGGASDETCMTRGDRPGERETETGKAEASEPHANGAGP